MKVKLKVKTPTEVENRAGQERLRNAAQRGIEAGFGPITRAKTPNGEAGTPLMVHVPEAMKAHIAQLAMVEKRSISSICKELLEVALGLVMTPEEAAADAASLAIVQRGQARGATDAEIAAATLEGIKRSTGLSDVSDFPPNPTTEDINHGRFDPFTQRWHPDWDWKNRRWLR